MKRNEAGMVTVERGDGVHLLLACRRALNLFKARAGGPAR